jgi:hypothetical protein
MKTSFYRRGLFALCVMLLPSCEMRTEPSRSQETTESRVQGDTSKEKLGDGAGQTPENKMNGRHEYLRLTLHNSTDGDIDETAIALGKHSFTFGIVGKGVSKDFLGWPHPVGTNAVVRWRDSGKTKRESQVDFSNVYNPKLPGNLTFTIAGTNVTVKFEKIDRK